MAKTWINHFIAENGTWTPAQPVARESAAQANFTTPATVRLYETARSGFVLFGAETGFSCGEPEVYLKINLSTGGYRYLSAPLGSSLDVENVSSLQLYILYSVAAPGATSVPYRAWINAHCVYEVL